MSAGICCKTFSPIISPTKTRLVFWGEAKNGQHGGAVRKEGTAQWAGRGGDEHRVAGARRRNVAGGGPVRRREPFRLAHMLKSSLSSATVQYIGKYTDFSECVPARTSRS